MPDPAGGGDRPLFAAEEERDLATWVTGCHALGLIITREMFLDEVQRIIQLEQRGAKSVVVLNQWINAFRLRHAARLGWNVLLPARVADGRTALQSARAWYRSVDAALARAGQPGERPFSDPNRVLYLGEVNLKLEPRTALMALRSTRPPHDGTRPDNIGYVQAVSASGDIAPPMLVVPAGDLFRDDLAAGDDCFLQTTSTGRVTPTALIQYLVKTLEPHLTASGAAPRPVLVYVDGLRHHCSMTLTQFCDDEGLILVGLPPAGQARSPFRQAVTSLLAANFERLAAETRLGRRRSGPAGQLTLSLKYLLSGIRQACRRVCKQTVKQAFASSGLFPWGERVLAACEPEDGPAEQPGSPAVNGGPRPEQDEEADSDCVVVKDERESPPPPPPPRVSPPAAAVPPPTDPPEPADPAPDNQDPEPAAVDSDSDSESADQLVLPQARLTEYLAALDAAGEALEGRGSGEQAAVVLELKEKLRALHAASSALSEAGAEDGAEDMVAADDQRSHLPAGDPTWDGRPRSAAATSSLNRNSAAPAEPSPASRPPEGRSARGIKRPRRFDDFQCVDDVELRPGIEPAIPPPPVGTSDASPAMTELANKPPSALKSIIRILRSENAQLREQLETEKMRGMGLADGVEGLLREFRADEPP